MVRKLLTFLLIPDPLKQLQVPLLRLPGLEFSCSPGAARRGRTTEPSRLAPSQAGRASEGCQAYARGYVALHDSGEAAKGKQFPPFTLPKAQLQHPLRELYSKL